MHRSLHDPEQVGFHFTLSRRTTTWLLAAVFALAAAPSFADEQVDFAQRRLVGRTGVLDTLFGAAVAVSGETAVVGASAAARPDPTMGAAYIFAFNGNSWSRIAELAPPGLAQGDRFGWAVAISGDTVVVTAINDDESGSDDIGAAYVFLRNQGGPDNWGFVKKLAHSLGQAGELFGMSVAISGNDIAVGVPIYRDRRGAAVLYSRHQGGRNQWGEIRTFFNGDPASLFDDFGRSVAIRGDTLVIGAPFQEFGGDFSVGTVHIFDRNQNGTNQWGEIQTLTSSQPQSSSQFGAALAFSDALLVIGASLEDGALENTGAAYVFDRVGVSYEFAARLAPEEAVQDLHFGLAVAVTGRTVFIGAPGQRGRNDIAGSVHQFVEREGAWILVQRWVSPNGETGDEYGAGLGVSAMNLIAGARWGHGTTSSSGVAFGGPLLERIPQTREQQKCIVTMNKAFAKVAQAGDRWRQGCLKNHAKGKENAEACLATPDPKVAGLEAKTFSVEAKACGPPRNDFGPIGAALVYGSGRTLAADVVDALFGSNLDATIARAATARDESKCQLALAKAALRCAATQIKEFNRCKSRDLKSGEIQSTVGLEFCLGPDPKQKIAQKCVVSFETEELPKQCESRGVDLSDAFPGCNDDDVGDVARCIDARVSCAVCDALNGADDLFLACEACDQP